MRTHTNGSRFTPASARRISSLPSDSKRPLPGTRVAEKSLRGGPVTASHQGGDKWADTLRWAAGGELRFCACELCWSNKPFWRYAALVASHVQRARPGAGRAELAQGIWNTLRAGRWFARRRRGGPGLRRAVKALHEAAGREGWNTAQLYEAVLRGIALHWEPTG